MTTKTFKDFISSDSIVLSALFVLIVIVGVVAFVGALIVWQAWVTTMLWEWFIVPTFNAPMLNIPLAIGISLAIGSFRSYRPGPKETTPHPIWKAFIAPGLALVIGYFVHSLI